MIGDPTALMQVEIAVRFRFAVEADLPKLEWYGIYTHFRAVFARTYQEQIAGRRLMVIADVNDFPVGQIFVQISRGGSPQIADGRRRAYLYSLRVMEMFRNCGIGTRLIDEAEAILRDRRFAYATIAVAKTNIDALRLYERRSYRRIAEDEGRWSYTDHRGEEHFVHEPCWLLEKRLTFDDRHG